MQFLRRPDAIRVFGLEGGGNPAAGCFPNDDVFVQLGTDSDEDGAYDSTDRCPGYEDDLDSDGDGVPNGCDSDAATAVNGTACAQNSDCSSAHCVSGLCCNRSCVYPCEACDLSDSLGQCTTFAGEPVGPSCMFISHGVCTGEGPHSCDTDADGDVVADSLDVCPGFDDAADHDADGVPDGCDACPNDFLNDSDCVFRVT